MAAWTTCVPGSNGAEGRRRPRTANRPPRPWWRRPPRPRPVLQTSQRLTLPRSCARRVFAQGCHPRPPPSAPRSSILQTPHGRRPLLVPDRSRQAYQTDLLSSPRLHWRRRNRLVRRRPLSRQPPRCTPLVQPRATLVSVPSARGRLCPMLQPAHAVGRARRPHGGDPRFRVSARRRRPSSASQGPPVGVPRPQLRVEVPPARQAP